MDLLRRTPKISRVQVEQVEDASVVRIVRLTAASEEACYLRKFMLEHEVHIAHDEKWIDGWKWHWPWHRMWSSLKLSYFLQ